MHKKLESELISLAHQILQMKNKHDVVRLRDKAKDVYEKLSVLAFVDNYFITTPNVTGNKEEFVAKMEKMVEEKEIVNERIEKITEEVKTEEVKVEETKKEEVKAEKAVVSESIESKTEEIADSEVESNQLVKQTMQTIKKEAKEIVNKIQEQEVKISSKEMDMQALQEKEQAKRKTLEEEMEGSIPADVAANMFEKADKTEDKKIEIKKEEEPKPKQEIKEKKIEKQTETKTSLNDRLFQQKLQVGLNDRIAFVKHLFNFSQEDFNRVLSQLNTFETEQDCKDFISNVVKPDYDWSDKIEYEERLIALIERKFA